MRAQGRHTGSGYDGKGSCIGRKSLIGAERDPTGIVGRRDSCTAETTATIAIRKKAKADRVSRLCGVCRLSCLISGHSLTDPLVGGDQSAVQRGSGASWSLNRRAFTIYLEPIRGLVL